MHLAPLEIEFISVIKDLIVKHHLSKRERLLCLFFHESPVGLVIDFDRTILCGPFPAKQTRFSSFNFDLDLFHVFILYPLLYSYSTKNTLPEQSADQLSS